MSCGTALAGAEERPRERKHVTCLFADLVGSTTMGEQHDPELVQNVVAKAFTQLGRVVADFGGTVDKIMGDAILALFGVPVTHEDDPERAVRAGLAMQEMLDELNEQSSARGLPPIEMRVGIEAGEVMVMSQTTSDLPDRMVTGDAANTASRLQSSARPGAVLVGPAAHEATKRAFDYEEQDPLVLKGKSEPVRAWVAVRALGQQGSSRVGLESSELVGREEELETLRTALGRVVAQRRPGFVSVVAPPGVGKTRLVASFMSGSDPATVLYGRCLPYGNAPFSALRQAMRDRFGVSADEEHDKLATKVSDAIASMGAPDLFDAIATLVGVSTIRPMSREDLFDGWRDFFDLVSAEGGLSLVLEDVHWADEGLLDFVDYLTDWGEGPLLVVTVARPELLERRPGWGGGKPTFTAMQLEPLTPTQSEELLGRLLTDPIPQDVAHFILDRSEGNPLFLQEMANTLLDRGLIRIDAEGRWQSEGSLEEVSLPRSISGVIASRLDGLPPEERDVLQVAAVVGREFWPGAISHALDAEPESLRPPLDRLRRRGLISRRPDSQLVDQVELGFRHALIRDVAYQALPKGTRARHHASVAAWVEKTAGSRSDEVAELLATHYLEAARYLGEVGGDREERERMVGEAVRWAMLAGERSERVKDLHQAIVWLESARSVALGSQLVPSAKAQIAEHLADTLFPAGRLQPAAEAYRDALGLWTQATDQLAIGRVEAKLTFSSWYGGEDQRTSGMAEAALARLEPLGETKELALALVVGGMEQIYFRQEDGIPALRRGVAMAEATGDLATLTQGSTFLGTSLVHAGNPVEGISYLEKAEALARQSGDAESQIIAYGLLADALDSHAEEPQPDRVDQLAAEARSLGRRGGRALRLERTLDTIAWMEFQRGRLSAARAALEEQAAIAREHNLPILFSVMLLQAWTALVENRVDDAVSLRDEAARVQTIPSMRREIVDGLLLAANGDRDGALRTLSEAAHNKTRSPFEAGVEYRYLVLEAGLLADEAGFEQELASMQSLLADLAASTPSARPFEHWLGGLAAPDLGDRVRLLESARAGLARRKERISEARCTLDLAVSSREPDRERLRERALSELVECGALLYVPG